MNKMVVMIKKRLDKKTLLKVNCLVVQICKGTQMSNQSLLTLCKLMEEKNLNIMNNPMDTI